MGQYLTEWWLHYAFQHIEKHASGNNIIHLGRRENVFIHIANLVIRYGSPLTWSYEKHVRILAWPALNIVRGHLSGKCPYKYVYMCLHAELQIRKLTVDVCSWSFWQTHSFLCKIVVIYFKVQVEDYSINMRKHIVHCNRSQGNICLINFQPEAFIRSWLWRVLPRVFWSNGSCLASFILQKFIVRAPQFRRLTLSKYPAVLVY